MFDIVSLILTFISIVIVPITVYISLKQPIILRKVKRTQFLRFLGEYHKQVGEFLNDLKQLDTKPKKLGSAIGDGFTLYLLVVSVLYANNSALKYIHSVKYIEGRDCQDKG